MAFFHNQVYDDIEIKNGEGKVIREIFDFASTDQCKTAGSQILFLILLPKDSKKDYMGCFCVTTGFGVDEWAAEFERDLRFTIR
jgi:5-methyltetrahydrofolate--homocysteine methyltransferase